MPHFKWRLRAALFLTCSYAPAQLSTIPSARAVADLPGLPKNPPIFSPLTAIWQGGLEYHDSADFKGNVAKVEREEAPTTDDNSQRFRRKSTFTFDEKQHLAQFVVEDAMGVDTTTTEWDGAHMKSMTTKYHSNSGKNLDSEDWKKWSYDQRGHISEIRAGHDQEQRTWLVNFRYDQRGRLLGYEDKAVSLLEISYSGNKITVTRRQKYNHHKTSEQVEVLDNKKRVIDLTVLDVRSAQLRPFYHVVFKYDEKDRVIEQDTDPFKLKSSDDDSPLPGKVLITYDDEKRTGEQRVYDPDEKLVLHARFEFDRDGIFTKFRILDASANERPGSEIFVDAAKHVTTRPGQVEWEILYDNHGNWTERRRWFTPQDGSPRIMTRLVSQTITYQ